LSCYEYLNALETLYMETPERVLVSHDPLTDRYHRASQDLRDLIKVGRQLGYKIVREDESSAHVEIAIFIEPEVGSGSPGQYGVFRILLDKIEDQLIATDAELFAFYDNLPTRSDRGNKAINDLNGAKIIMRSYGYEDCES
jgi:hypothetical protein